MHSGDPGRARRRRRRLRETKRGRYRGEDAGVATGEESPAQELPPETPATRSPVPLPRSRCSLLLQSGISIEAQRQNQFFLENAEHPTTDKCFSTVTAVHLRLHYGESPGAEHVQLW